MIAWAGLAVAAVSLATWGYLLAFRGGFWLARERDDRNEPPEPAAWPSVVAVVPARDEADVIAASIGSLLAQDYPGDFRVVLVDDNSTDGTGDVARSLILPAHPGESRGPGSESAVASEKAWVPAFAGMSGDRGGALEVISGAPLASGWTGKLWAVRQGIERAGQPDYLLLTDADIAHDPRNLRALVARAEAGGLVLTSLMAKLTTATWAERLLIPAFVFFFDMLFPFAWVNDPKRKVAAAAGGCMLVRREALEAAGGIDSIRTRIIDDCALAELLAAQGPIWLGLTTRAQSLRPYATWGELRRMVARSAYAQLNFSPWLLAGTVLGMALVYLAGPVAALAGTGLTRWLGVATWAAMALAYQPILRLYRLSPLWGVAMPLIGLIYTAFTLDSAVQHARGKGGFWKGRAQAAAATR